MNARATPKATPPNTMVFATSEDLRANLLKWVGDTFSDPSRGTCLIVVGAGESPRTFTKLPAKLARVLIIFTTTPVEMTTVDEWRRSAMDREAWEIHIAFLPFYQGSEQERYQAIVALCEGWSIPQLTEEPEKVAKGKVVQMSGDLSGRNLATLLTMTLGAMGDLLTRAEVLARRFRKDCPLKGALPDAEAYETYRKQIDALLKSNESGDKPAPKLSKEPSPDALPKLLLRGDSGVGKSLIAGYVHSRIGWKDRIARIPIPEYLGKEDMFEYDLFGYCKGAYTDGKPEGSRGLLLTNVGKVVFLDEIGEANEYLQAKLLAFLDDYRVRPRGWDGEPFYCPVLIVAATNKNLDEMAQERKFRGDLLARFTDRRIIPGLNERKGDLPFILDCLLQRPAMNPGLEIESIGEGAFEEIEKFDFTDGNFRQLENMFRGACELALRDNRKFLVRSDIVKSSADLTSQ